MDIILTLVVYNSSTYAIRPLAVLLSEEITSCSQPSASINVHFNHSSMVMAHRTTGPFVTVPAPALGDWAGVVGTLTSSNSS
jgi:hypothetical protein